MLLICTRVNKLSDSDKVICQMLLILKPTRPWHCQITSVALSCERPSLVMVAPTRQAPTTPLTCWPLESQELPADATDI
jgi:hypothetical protein